jgi:hypothetical protein
VLPVAPTDPTCANKVQYMGLVLGGSFVPAWMAM